MPTTRSRQEEQKDSPNLRPKQRTRMENNNLTMDQLLEILKQQNDFNMNQLRLQLEETNKKFETLVKNGKSKGQPPTYEGKVDEDLELWIFSTTEYYSNSKELIKADNEEIVQEVSINLKNIAKTWYRSYCQKCTSKGVTRTWENFLSSIRERFRPKDFEIRLRRKLLHLEQRGSIHDYISRFQRLLSQAEIPISELELRVYFQNKLRNETSRHIDEKSPKTLQETMDLATNYEYAYYPEGEKNSKIGQNGSFKSKAGQNGNFRKMENNNQRSKFTNEKENSKGIKFKGWKAESRKPTNNEDWKKSKTCFKCKKVGHISTDCKDKDSVNYIENNFGKYAALNVKAEVFNEEGKSVEGEAFIDNGSSLVSISEELARALSLEIKEDPEETMEVQLGFDQKVNVSKRTVLVKISVPGFKKFKGFVNVMPIPDNKDIMLGMLWLRENNPDIDWRNLTLKPRKNQVSNDQKDNKEVEAIPISIKKNKKGKVQKSTINEIKRITNENILH